MAAANARWASNRVCTSAGREVPRVDPASYTAAHAACRREAAVCRSPTDAVGDVVYFSIAATAAPTAARSGPLGSRTTPDIATTSADATPIAAHTAPRVALMSAAGRYDATAHTSTKKKAPGGPSRSAATT